MVKVKEKTIKSTVILSDDENYRYKLARVWDEEKPKATIVMLNPSTADMLVTDRTVMNVTNFLIANNYGAITIVNLYAYRKKAPKYLDKREENQEILNDKYLNESFEVCDLIIVAWVRDKGKYVNRKREVEHQLYQHKYKTKCFVDGKGKKLRHPRDLNEDWKLDNYEFIYI